MPKNSTRANDFRYIYASGFTMVFNGSEGIVRFGIKDSEEDVIYEQMGVIMTPQSMKLLGVLLSKTVEMLETSSGSTIPIDPDKVKSMDDALAAAREVAQKKMASASPNA